MLARDGNESEEDHEVGAALIAVNSVGGEYRGDTWRHVSGQLITDIS